MTESNLSPRDAFARALELPPDERSPFLEALGRGDHQLRARVERLLEAHASAEGFLGDSIWEPAAPSRRTEGAAGGATVSSSSDNAPLPRHVGPYRVLDVLGEGGMGIVYLAEQKAPIRRPVALKLIRLGMDTKEVTARFDAERQALALMDHPNVARVYDAGATEDGRPYFVMEHIRGVPVHEYCDAHGLSIRGRLELFTQVCRGVDHAHRCGIVHRDLKPSNVLVTTVDGEPVAKIIDFGVARATNQSLTERAISTEIGRVVGTPAYMSPEQARMAGGEKIDRRTDIYSLGVMLYEMLVGELPLDAEVLRNAAYDEVRRQICEEDPPTPATRLMRLNVERGERLAASRGTAPRELARALRGDLDWITMRCLEKERGRRYRTAAELAADIERHFRGDPVHAGPPSVAYKVRRFVTRHRGLVVSTAAVLIALTTGLIVSLLFYGEARHSASEAKRQAFVANIVQAGLYLDDGNVVGAGRLIEACAPEHRTGWEWKHLELRADLSLQTLEGHESDVVAVAVSPDDKLIASTSDDKTVRLWDGDTARFLREIGGRETLSYQVEFGPRGKRMATRDDEAVRVWDVDTGGILATLRGQSPWMAFSGRALLAAAVSKDTGDVMLRRWNPGSSGEVEDIGEVEVVSTFHRHGDSWNAMALDSDRRRIASGSVDGTVRLWSVESGSLIGSPMTRHEKAIEGLAFSADGRRLASSSIDGSLLVWDVENSAVVAHLEDGVDRSPWWEINVPFSVAFTPDGRRVVAGMRYGSVRIHDVERQELVGDLVGHKRNVRVVAISPGGTRIVSGSEDKTVRLWDLEMLGASIPFRAHEAGPFALAVSPDGRWIASAGDRVVKVWDAETFEVRKTLKHSGLVNSVAFSQDARRIVSGCRDGTAWAWTVGTGDATVFEGHQPDSLGVMVAVSPDGRLVASGCAQDSRTPDFERGIRVWEASSGQLALRLLRLNRERGFRCVAWSPVGAHIASGYGGWTVALWDAHRGDLLFESHEHRSEVMSVAFSPDGSYLASGGKDNVILVWDTEARGEEPDPLFRLPNLGFRIASVAFSPSGTRLVSAGTKSVRVWDFANEALVAVLRGHQGFVRAAAFSADERRIFSAAADGTIRVWETELSTARRTWSAAAGR